MALPLTASQNAIRRQDNQVVIEGKFSGSDFRRVLACLHQAVHERGYADVVFDFRNCVSAFPISMVPICCAAQMYRLEGVLTSVRLPEKDDTLRLFLNANWAHLLDTEKEPSSFKGHIQIPVTQFMDPKEQYEVVVKVVDSILKSTPDLERSDLAAIEWAFNEITDNVLVHANSRIGGLVQLSTQRVKKKIEFVVCDAGQGIFRSLRPTHPYLDSDLTALEIAIREGVTRDKDVGQGNGLFGSAEICRISGGYFKLASGNALLQTDQRQILHLKNEKIPLNGTMVAACIDYSVGNVLQDALKFDDKLHTQVDFIEAVYESDEDPYIVFRLSEESFSFGTRFAAVPLRNKLINLLKMAKKKRIRVDFSDVAIVSSSFADELFAKLFVAIGEKRFLEHFELWGLSNLVRGIIDRAIKQRIQRPST